ncbi:MAG TPA: PRC-barrel domain-containing protein [Longimicrobiales bacterium]
MARNKDRLRRDQAGVGPDPESARRHGLVPMHDLDGYRIADGEPDIRGWDVRTLSGHEIGEIEELLIDPERGEVVMIEVELRDGGVHAEVPIRSVQLDREGKAVIVDSGDLDARHDVRARDRLDATDRAVIRERTTEPRSITYGTREDHPVERAADRTDADDVDEVVIERKPIVEEVVLRRRTIEEE